MQQMPEIDNEASAAQTFERLVRTYDAPIGRYLRGLVGDREVARDLSQDTFLAAWRSFAPDRLHNPRAWLYRIATNKAMSWFRRQRVLSWVRLDRVLMSGKHPQTDGHDDAVATRDAVQRALSALEPDQRASLLLRAAGFSSDEIGQHLGCSPGAARTRLSRARTAFRHHYRTMQETEGCE
jgi:RNA polymerase sigma-70 factor, ECF subfamily